MADAGDLKSLALKRACGFDSHPGHHGFRPLFFFSVFASPLRKLPRDFFDDC